MNIELKVLNKEFYKGRKLPAYATAGSAALDLISTEDLTLCPGECKLIHTGLAIYIKDPSVVGIINCRSGLGTKGLILANTQGWIDSDYQGEVIISALNRNNLFNHSSTDTSNGDSLFIKAGERVAQLMFVPIIKAQFNIVEEFNEDTTRGSGGFGSTG